MIHIFDIETRPRIDLVAKYNKPFDPNSVKVGNLKCQIKIDAKINEAEQIYNDALIDKAALNPATSEICAIGIHLEDAEEVNILSGKEADILDLFWTCYMQQGGIWASYSGSNDKSNFDVRHIIHRSWIRRVKVPYGVIENGFISKSFKDLAQQYLAGAPYPTYCSADNCAKQLSLIGTTNDAGKVLSKDVLDHEKGISGKNFHEFWDSDSEHKRKLAELYLKNDVALERGVADLIL